MRQHMGKRFYVALLAPCEAIAATFETNCADTVVARTRKQRGFPNCGWGTQTKRFRHVGANRGIKSSGTWGHNSFATPQLRNLDYQHKTTTNHRKHSKQHMTTHEKKKKRDNAPREQYTNHLKNDVVETRK